MGTEMLWYCKRSIEIRLIIRWSTLCTETRTGSHWLRVFDVVLKFFELNNKRGAQFLFIIE